jgi:hypothetical protein
VLVGCDAADLAAWLQTTGCTRLQLIDGGLGPGVPAEASTNADLSRTRPLLRTSVLRTGCERPGAPAFSSSTAGSTLRSWPTCRACWRCPSRGTGGRCRRSRR